MLKLKLTWWIMIKNILPFLKWAGGKRWFTKNYSVFFPQTYNRYIEPFLGGGSVYFYMQPIQALLGDINEELINAYVSIRDNCTEVEEKLKIHQLNHNEDYYYLIRDETPINPIERATRLIYLNRTCFNGIYRVNMQGKFNVPKGTKNKVVLEIDNFQEISEILSTAKIYISDFEKLIDEAGKDDFIFADPPYTVRHNNNGFIKYNEKLFSWHDQIRLANCLWRAHSRGAKIIATNANNQLICDLYKERDFNIMTVSRYSSISANPLRRNQYEEIIIYKNIK